jgi:hypothetical protein
VSKAEFTALMDDTVVFGSYCPKFGRRQHFCVDQGRRTVDGRRLAWLWVFPDGAAKKAHKKLDDAPAALWNKKQILDAWKAANDATLPVFTRHVDTYSELAVTFCLPPP